jgi:hypothetical protein
MGGFTCQEIKAKVDKLKETINEYEDAALALATGQIAQYSYNTGQTIQTVTKLDIQKLEDVINMLYNRLAILCNRYPECTGGAGGSIIARPAW